MNNLNNSSGNDGRNKIEQLTQEELEQELRHLSRFEESDAFSLLVSEIVAKALQQKINNILSKNNNEQ